MIVPMAKKGQVYTNIATEPTDKAGHLRDLMANFVHDWTCSKAYRKFLGEHAP